MKTLAIVTAAGVASAWFSMGGAGPVGGDAQTGKACDSRGFLAAAIEAEEVRSNHRVTAEEFAEAAADPITVILDARGSEFYAKLHVEDAVNLPYTHFTAESLAEAIPEKSTRILSYCRNNLTEPPATPSDTPKKASPSVEPTKNFAYPTEFDPPEIPKNFAAGLNIPTFITLRS